MDTDEIKLDIDNHSWGRYLKFFAHNWGMIRAAKRIETVAQNTYLTRKGYHIYMTLSKPVPYDEALLIECLLGSDRNKQLHAYCDTVDILFRAKHGRNNEIFSKKHTAELDSILLKVNQVYIRAEASM